MQTYKTYLLYFLIIGNTVSLIFLNRHLFDDFNKKGSSTNSARFDNLNKKESPKNRAQKISIALLHPASCPAVDAIVQGFKEELAKEERLECSYTTYNNQSYKNTLNAHAEEVTTEKNFDLILTVGHSTSIKTIEVAQKKECRTPIVFTAVGNPVEVGIVPKDRDHTCFITGSSCQNSDSYEKGFKLLLLVKPDIKRLLLPYNPASDPIFLRTITNLEHEALSRGITVEKIAIFSVEECIPKLKTFIQEGDVIVIPRSPMVMAVTSDIAHLALRYGATVYALSSDAIEQGAAFCFSADDKVHGTNAGKKAREILVDRKHPADVPITPAPYNPYLLINEKALKSPTLKINPLVRLLAEIENVKVATGRAHP